MAEFQAPGVFIEEVPLRARPIEGVPTETAAFVGSTERAAELETGTDLTGEPIMVFSLIDFERSFGGSGGASYGLHDALRLFFENGGSRAVIVSVGPFGPPDLAQLRTGLHALDGETESSILLAPDALRLPRDEYYAFVLEMIENAAASRRRVAIVDLHGGTDSEASLAASVADFRAAMAGLSTEARSFGAAYHPYLISNGEPVPPSAAVAGLWARNDIERAVWKAPANLSPLGVSELSFAMSEAGQERLNTAPDGLSVNAIRAFPVRGILVWGARTLAAGPSEVKYVSVRRTLIFVEQSVSRGLQPFVFEPNAVASWGRVQAVVEDFLFGLWRAGALAGTKPEQGFFVRCGLGTTMTQQDLDAGQLIVDIGIALLQPAEFVIVRIGLQMAASDPPPP